MTHYVIETTPIPAEKHKSGVLHYPFGALQVGQSFLVPLSEGQKLRSAATYYSGSRGIWLSVRKISGVGYRCYRTK